MNVINVAQIGVGYWGPNLLRNLIDNKKCQVQSVVDLSPERRSYVKGLHSPSNVIGNVESVFTDGSISAVVIATPAQTHFQLVA